MSIENVAELSPRSPDPDDRELVRRIAARDEAALAQLHDRHAPMLLALARRVLHDTEDAEEVLQETFLQVWRQAERYDTARSSVPTWLVLIARSRAIDRLRNRQVVDRTLSAVQQETPPLHTSPQGVGSVLREERRERLRTAMADLPTEQRQALDLAFYQGMTQSEIAAETGIPLGTVKTRTLLAMRKLRAALGPELHELL